MHHHVDLVESVRGGRKVETCRASLPHRCAHPEFLDDTDDLEPGIGVPGGRIVPIRDEAHLLADGIPPLQHLVHEALIDDRDPRTGREIGGIERATGENGSLQHVEVRRLDARDGRLAERQSWIRARDAGRLER